MSQDLRFTLLAFRVPSEGGRNFHPFCFRYASNYYEEAEIEQTQYADDRDKKYRQVGFSWYDKN